MSHEVSDCLVHFSYRGIVICEVLAWIVIHLQTREAFKCAPESWIQLKGFGVKFNCLFSFDLAFTNVAKEV